MVREPGEGEPDHHLAGPGRPVALALDHLEPFEEAAKVEQKIGEVGADRLQHGVRAV